jgi:flagellar assembly factor FliW
MEFELKSQVLGFENLTKLKLEKIDDLFAKATNVDDEHPSFMLVNPYMLREYNFELPQYIKALLNINDESKNIAVYNTMVIQSPLENSLINFLAPFVFNFDNQSVAQVVLDNIAYPDYGILEPFNKFINNDE